MLGLTLACALAGCQSTRGQFQLDSNSRVPWFGLDLSLPKPSARRKSLQTIGQADTGPTPIVRSEERLPLPSAAPSRRLLSRWIGGEPGIPAPAESAPRDGEPISLAGPRAEFQ